MNKTTRSIRNIMTLLLAVLLTLVLVACGKTAASDTGSSDGDERKSKNTTSESTNDENTNDTDSNNENSNDKKTNNNNNNTNDNTDNKANNGQNNNGSVNNVSSTIDAIDPDEIFSDRDLEQSPDLADATVITVADGKTIDITEAGVYRIAGTAADCTIRVDAGLKDKVGLVLDGVTITNRDFPAIYIVSADKCFITTVKDSSLSVTGTFRADGTTNTDAVIFSRDDITLNGTATLTVNSAKGNGISCKDDIKVTGGTYVLTTELDSLEANDSIAICGGPFTITSQKDGLHSENEDDNTTGYLYISGGNFAIQAKSDGFQGTTFVRIDGGSIKIKASEGIEATYVEINDGDIDIYGSDDGINASRKSTAYSTPTVVFNGGNIKIEVGRGDTDAVDANGDIYVNGGTIDVTANGLSSFDYDGKAEFNGGTIYINGEKVDSIPKSMFGPGQGGRGGWGGNGNNNGNNNKGNKGNKGNQDNKDNKNNENKNNGNRLTQPL